MRALGEFLIGILVAIVGGPDAPPYEVTLRMTGLFFGSWAAMIYGVRYGKRARKSLRNLWRRYRGSK